MKSQRSAGPDRREFMKRLGGAAVYGVPVVAVLGSAGRRSNPDEVARHWRQAVSHLNEADRIGREHRWTDRDWEVVKPVLEELEPPIKKWPPDWCEIC